MMTVDDTDDTTSLGLPCKLLSTVHIRLGVVLRRSKLLKRTTGLAPDVRACDSVGSSASHKRKGKRNRSLALQGHRDWWGFNKKIFSRLPFPRTAADHLYALVSAAVCA